MEAEAEASAAAAAAPAPAPDEQYAPQHEQQQQQHDEQQPDAQPQRKEDADAGASGGASGGAGGGGGGNKRESVPYLKKLLSVAKRSIDDLKKKLQQRDEALQAQRKENKALQEQLERVKDLTRRAQRRIEDLEARLEDAQGEVEEPGCPIAARLRVRDEASRIVWCLVETAPGVTEWVEEDEIYDRVGSNTIPFPMPALSLTESESATLSEKEAQLAKDLEETRDKFRKYKIKAEMSMKRKDAEVARLAENNLKYKQHNITGHDYYSQLEYSRSEIERLSTALDTATKEGATMRKRNTDLERRLRNADSDQHALHKRIATLEASAKNSGGESADPPAPPAELSAKTSSLRRADSSGSEHASLLEKHKSLLEQHGKLRDEYDKFRLHAQGLLEEKDRALAASQGAAEGSAARADGKAGADPEDGAEDTAAAAATQAATEREYIKNIFLKYLGANEGVEKQTIEAALATALRFSPDQVKWIQDQKSSAAVAQAAAGGLSRFFFSS